MADKPLGRIYFPVLKKTSSDAGRSNPDPFGVFSCNLNAARFLDIDGLSVPLPVVEIERTAGRRSITLADGTKLVRTPAGENVNSSRILLSVSGRGSRSVILKTGNPIEDSLRVKNKASAFHTISFRFPSFMTALDISIALGQLIPLGKMRNPPRATDVWGYFTIKGGRKYPIMEKSDADADTKVQVATTAADLAGLLGGRIKAIRDGAGTV